VNVPPQPSVLLTVRVSFRGIFSTLLAHPQRVSMGRGRKGMGS
jgi:hypothetical protein